MHMCIASVIHLNMALFLVNIYSRPNTILSLTQTKHCKCISAIRAWLKPSHTHPKPTCACVGGSSVSRPSKTKWRLH